MFCNFEIFQAFERCIVFDCCISVCLSVRFWPMTMLDLDIMLPLINMKI